MPAASMLTSRIVNRPVRRLSGLLIQTSESSYNGFCRQRLHKTLYEKKLRDTFAAIDAKHSSRLALIENRLTE